MARDRSSGHSSFLFRRGQGGEPLLEIPDQIFDRLETDRQAHRSGGDTGRSEFVIAQLAVSRAGGVNDEALRIADVGQMGPQRHRTNEVLPAVALSRAL